MTEENKKLGVFALAALVISAMIGGGIFSMPQNIAQGASVMAVIAAWAISGVGIFFLAGRIAANALIPYPPGIPMVISGERFGSENNPHISYLQSLSAWDAQFPGFEHVTEGATVINGIYHIPCIASEK